MYAKHLPISRCRRYSNSSLGVSYTFAPIDSADPTPLTGELTLARHCATARLDAGDDSSWLWTDNGLWGWLVDWIGARECCKFEDVRSLWNFVEALQLQHRWILVLRIITFTKVSHYHILFHTIGYLWGNCCLQNYNGLVLSIITITWVQPSLGTGAKAS